MNVGSYRAFYVKKDYVKSSLPQIASDECFMDLPHSPKLPSSSPAIKINYVCTEETDKSDALNRLAVNDSLLSISKGYSKPTESVYLTGFSGDTSSFADKPPSQTHSARDAPPKQTYISKFIALGGGSPLSTDSCLDQSERMPSQTFDIGQPIPKLSLADIGETDPYADFSDEDRRKATAWAAALENQSRVSFIPEMVLQTGFQIQKYGSLWVPLTISVNEETRHITFLYPETFLDTVTGRIAAHRIEPNEYKCEIPKSKKNRRPTAPDNSQRRLKLVRTDGKGSYAILGPSNAYRNRFMELVSQLSGVERSVCEYD